MTGEEKKKIEREILVTGDQVRAVRVAYHRSHAPDISAGAPFTSEDDFRRAVLAGLDIVCKVVSNPTGVTQIGYLDGDNIDIVLVAGHGLV